MFSLDPAAAACLDRTRAAVVNILVVISFGIAVSGLLLRWRDRWMAAPAPDWLRRSFLAGLVALTVSSYLARRIMGARTLLRDPTHRGERFFRAHVISAVIGGLAIPLGLAYGWFIRARLDAVAPFWVAAFALGFLALPRAHELEGLDPNDSKQGAPKP